MMTFDNYNSTKDNNSGGGSNTTATATAAPTRSNTSSNQDLSQHHHYHRPSISSFNSSGQYLHHQQGQPSHQQQGQLYSQHYDYQQGLNIPLMQSTGGTSPTHPFNQTTTSATATTPMWNVPYNTHSSYYQPTSSIGSSNRRNSLIDSTNIWSTSSNQQPSTNIWSTSLNLQTGQQQQQQQQQQVNFPPSLENYISTSSIVHNRSSLIPGFSSTPPPPSLQGPSQQQQQPSTSQQSIVPQISLKEPFSTTTPTEISPNQFIDPLMRRRSFTDTLSSGGPTPTSTTAPATTITSASSATTPGGSTTTGNLNVISDKSTLQMVDDYFESDPHERVKVTLQLLNERFLMKKSF